MGPDDNRLRNPGDEWFEVIDGQQRLTTIYLILRYINEFWVGRQQKGVFEIDYETARNNCVEFLQQIRADDDDANTVTINKDHIDFYHISKAYQAIRTWELNYRDSHNGKDLDSGGFQSAFLHYTKVIWYEISNSEDSEQSEKLFERLNLGKIPLTNAELTKAMFLTSDSFIDRGKEEQRLKHFEIALVWDEIEHELNAFDGRFWSFITNERASDYATKIELLLDLVAEKPTDARDPLYTFLSFQEERKTRDLADIWSDIERFYRTLVEWHSDRDLYHLVGYLITIEKIKKSRLKDLVKCSMKHPKPYFREQIRSLVSEAVNGDLTDLDYSSERDKKMLFNVLLLFNVETSRRKKTSWEFYPFKEHKSSNWSLEHIHARNSDGLDRTKREQWLEWLELHEPVLRDMQGDKDLVGDPDDIESVLKEIQAHAGEKLTWERFSKLFAKVNALLTDASDEIGFDGDGLSNMALLSQPDNAALNCSAFAVKRREIVRLDKDGSFIPVCTRRAFMKYYAKEDQSVQHFFWSPDDRKAYQEEIHRLLKDYLPQTEGCNSDETG